MGFWDDALTGLKWGTGVGEVDWLANKAGNAVSAGPAPTIGFQANSPALDHASYAAAIQQAQQQALMGNGQASQTGGQQAALAQALMAQASGQAPSLAQMQLQQGTDRNNALAAGAMASQRGINPALAQRLVMQNQASSNQSAVGQSAMARLQEQMAAREQLGQVLAAQRSGDVGQMQANGSLFGAAGQLQNAQNANMTQNSFEAQRLNQQTAAQNAQLTAATFQADAAMRAKLLGGVISGAGSAAAAGIGAAQGGMIPGRASMPGDSPSNDTVPAMLSPGEVVLPRSVAEAEDAPEKAAEFVKAIKKKKDMDPSEGYARLLAKHGALEARLQRIEALYCGGRVM